MDACFFPGSLQSLLSVASAQEVSAPWMGNVPGEGVSSQSYRSWHKGRVGSPVLTLSLAQPHRMRHLNLDG